MHLVYHIKKAIRIVELAKALYRDPWLELEIAFTRSIKKKVGELSIYASQYAAILESFADTAESQSAASEAAFLRRRAAIIRKKLNKDWRI